MSGNYSPGVGFIESALSWMENPEKDLVKLVDLRIVKNFFLREMGASSMYLSIGIDGREEEIDRFLRRMRNEKAAYVRSPDLIFREQTQFWQEKSEQAEAMLKPRARI